MLIIWIAAVLYRPIQWASGNDEALPDALRLSRSRTGWYTLRHDSAPGCLFHGLDLFPVPDLLDADFTFNELVDISDDDGSLNIHQRERWNWVAENPRRQKERLKLIAWIVTRYMRL
jgi:hypothetical protein